MPILEEGGAGEGAIGEPQQPHIPSVGGGEVHRHALPSGEKRGE